MNVLNVSFSKQDQYSYKYSVVKSNMLYLKLAEGYRVNILDVGAIERLFVKICQHFRQNNIYTMDHKCRYCTWN